MVCNKKGGSKQPANNLGSYQVAQSAKLDMGGKFLLFLKTILLQDLSGFKKQEGHDGPVSLHWLIFGNLFKT